MNNGAGLLIYGLRFLNSQCGRLSMPQELSSLDSLLGLRKLSCMFSSGDQARAPYSSWPGTRDPPYITDHGLEIQSNLDNRNDRRRKKAIPAMEALHYRGLLKWAETFQGQTILPVIETLRL